MVKSQATTVAEYLASLPDDRREVIATVLDVIRKNIPAGYNEGMNWGMIAFEIPLSRYPKTYNKQPLLYVALGSQKNYISLHLPCVYADPKRAERLHADFEKSGKKLNMGKGCVRFKKLDDLDLDAIGRLIAAVPVDKFIALCESGRKKS